MGRLQASFDFIIPPDIIFFVDSVDSKIRRQCLRKGQHPFYLFASQTVFSVVRSVGCLTFLGLGFFPSPLPRRTGISTLIGRRGSRSSQRNLLCCLFGFLETVHLKYKTFPVPLNLYGNHDLAAAAQVKTQITRPQSVPHLPPPPLPPLPQDVFGGGGGIG